MLRGYRIIKIANDVTVYVQKDALDTAVEEDRLEDVELMLQHGANPMINCWLQEDVGNCNCLERAILNRKKYTTPTC